MNFRANHLRSSLTGGPACRAKNRSMAADPLRLTIRHDLVTCNNCLKHMAGKRMSNQEREQSKVVKATVSGD